MQEYLEFLSASTMMESLQYRKAAIKQGLEKRHGDIMLIAELKRIESDISELDKVMTHTGFTILSAFQAKYNCKFTYLLNRVKPNPAG